MDKKVYIQITRGPARLSIWHRAETEAARLIKQGVARLLTEDELLSRGLKQGEKLYLGKDPNPSHSLKKTLDSALDTSIKRCKALTGSGQPCTRLADKDGYCWQHGGSHGA